MADEYPTLRPLNTPEEDDLSQQTSPFNDVTATDIFGEDETPKTSPQNKIPSNPTPTRKDFLDVLLGTEDGDIKAPEVSNKELTYDPNKTLGFMGEFKGGFAENEREWRRNAAKTLFPSEPVDESEKKIQRTKEGRYYYQGDDNKFYEVRPPSGLKYWTDTDVAPGIGHSIPNIFGMGAEVATTAEGPFGVWTYPIAGGLGQSFGESVRQGIGNLFQGDVDVRKSEKNPTELTGQLLGEFLKGSMGSMFGIGVGKLLNRFTVSDIDQLSQMSAEQLMDLGAKYNIKLTPGEATNLASLLGEQKAIMASDRGSNVMRKFYIDRNMDAANSWRSFLDRVAPSKDPSLVGENSKNIVKGIVRRKENERTKSSMPYYDAVHSVSGPVNTQNIIDFIDKELPLAKDTERKGLEFAKDQLFETLVDKKPIKLPNGKMGTPPRKIDTSTEGLDKAKQALDRIISDTSEQEKRGLDAIAIAQLKRVREKIIQEINKAPNVGKLYDFARGNFEAETRNTVDPARQAAAPFRMVNEKTETNIMNAGRKVLDPQFRDPKLVAQTRKLFVDNGYENEWNDIVRNFLQQEGVQALKVNTQGEISNAAGNISKRFQPETDMPNLKAAMTPAQYKDFSDLMEVFRAAGRASDVGSDTYIKLPKVLEQKEKYSGAVAKGFDYARLNFLKRAQDFFGKKSYEKQMEIMANIITSGDKRALSQLKSLKNYKDKDWRKLALIGKVLFDLGYIGTQEYTRDD